MDYNIDMRDAFIGELYNRALNNKDIIFLSAEFGAPSLDAFRHHLPTQFINVGISEQNLISVAAGLALEGKRVYAYSIASFITLRCYEQIKIDLCVMNLPVTLLGVGPCYAYSADGPTHHATEDIAVIRALANMTIYNPSDTNMASALVDISLKSPSPLYIRLDRGRYQFLYPPGEDLSAGFRMVKKGTDVCLLATGCMVHRAMEVEKALAEHGIKVCVIDIYRLKPLDATKLIECIRGFSHLVTLEEHTLIGGLGSLILEILSDAGLCIPVKRFGIADSQLYAYGLRNTLHQQRGMDADSIAQTIQKWSITSGKNRI
jgi:transketolase